MDDRIETYEGYTVKDRENDHQVAHYLLQNKKLWRVTAAYILYVCVCAKVTLRVRYPVRAPIPNPTLQGRKNPPKIQALPPYLLTGRRSIGRGIPGSPGSSVPAKQRQNSTTRQAGEDARCTSLEVLSRRSLPSKRSSARHA